MQNPGRQKIVIAGCGNVAWHIAKKLQALGNYSVFVYNHRHNSMLDEFKKKLKCKTGDSLEHIINDADFYFICVDDKHIESVAKKISCTKPNAVLLHTSGSIKLNVLGERAHATGVFYPLQTFSSNDEVVWDKIPIVVEASAENSTVIVQLAKKFSDTVILLDYEQRLKLHLAAVLVNNFTNALYQAASEFLARGSRNKNLNFDLLLPLISQTTEKVKRIDPLEAQTGPARRHDKPVLKKHISLLSKHEDLKKIYKLMSKLIVKQQERKYD